MPKEVLQDIVSRAGLGGSVGCLAINARTGEVIEALNPALPLPPASVAKAATASYGLARLGAAYKFKTRLLAGGPISGGQIDGDLILEGGGDPVLDSDALADIVIALKDQGIHTVKGGLRVDASALPKVPFIDPDQPDHVSYNPAVAGINLNFNRVHFEWRRNGRRYDVTMQARAQRYRPEVRLARMTIEDRKTPVYTHDLEGRTDQWTVARDALGQDGARWLPVSHPEDYTSEVFRTIARSHGIVLRAASGPVSTADPIPIVEHRSPPLAEMVKGMLRFSTNLTAETIGMTATASRGTTFDGLAGSSAELNRWATEELGANACDLIDHSGLGYDSRIAAQDMVRILHAARPGRLLPKLLHDFRTEVPGAVVKAKTGTLNFVSSLAGYAEAPGSPPIVFAIFTADLARRDAIKIEERERPPGARSWSRRSRNLQRQLITRWLALARA